MKMSQRTRFSVIAVLVCGFAFGAQADALDTWFFRNSGTTAALTAVTYGDGSFVAVGFGGVVLTSTNGSDWVSRSSSQRGDFYCATFGNGIFVAPTTGSFPATFTNIALSSNGSNWVGSAPATNGYLWGYFGASYAGGLYLLVGSSASIQTATNLDLSCAGRFTNCSWVLRHFGGTRQLAGVAYGNGIYAAVGDFISMTSTDAVTWASNSISGRLYDVAFGNGVFVAVGNGTILTSSDGIGWTNRAFGGGNLYRVAFGNGTFVAVGYLGRIVTSTDGVTWRTRTPPLAIDALTGITYGDGTFIATGTAGRILQSASVSVPSLTATRDSPSGGIALALAGEIGRSYRIQVSTNLATSGWEDFRFFTNTAPTMEFLDTEAINLPQRFYRAVSP